MNHGLVRVLALAAGLWLVWTPAAAAENYWGFGIPQFQQTQVLRADWLPDDLVDGDVAYGAAIALDGDWLLVGVPGRLGSTGLRRGAVYLYQRDGLNWQQRQRIQFGTGGGGECGSAVAMRGGWAAIGCPEHVSGGLAARGRVLLYRLDPAAGQLGDPLTYLGEAENERCGKSLALVGSGLANQTWLAIGCPGRESVPGSAIGAVELHRYVLGGVPPSPTWNAWGSVNAVVDHIPALEGSQFGQHLAMEQTPDFGGTIRLLVGMPGARVNGLVNAGLAFVYERPLSGGEWSLRKRLHSNLGAQAHARFGAAVDLSAGRLVVGATEVALAVESEGTGAVFPFIRVPDGMGFDWLAGTPLGQDARWLVDSAGEGFAAAVALDGDELWVGQPVFHPDRSQAYVQRYRFIQGQGFVRAQTVFLERIFEHPLRGSELGLALAIDPARRTAVISAPSARMAAEDQAGLPWGRTLVMTASERMFQDRFQARIAGPSEVFKDCRDCPAMVGIKLGSFMMGGRADDVDVDAAELPAREVQIAAFAMSRTEVTFAEWDACVAAGGCAHVPDDGGLGRGDRPVAGVSWHDAQQYIAWLSARTGRPYRLPSEAEWEYAAGFGTPERFPEGSCIGTEEANFRGDTPATGCPATNVSRGRALAVGSFPPNVLGLHDMQGNVLEWTRDCWNESYQGAPSDGSPWLTGDCSAAPIRGGSYADWGGALRLSARDWDGRNLRSAFIGFRVAASLVP